MTNEGDEVKVKVLGIDDRGKVKLSMRVVDQESGADITEEADARKRGQRSKPGSDEASAE